MRPPVIPGHLTGKALFDFIVKNESLIIHAKKSEIKKADECFATPMYINEKGELVTKDEAIIAQVDPTKIKAVLVINTTNWYDSHGDVHIPGLWKKSLSDNRKQGFYLLNTHRRDFEDVIAEGMTGEAKVMSWTDLGINIPGNTEALVFTGIIEKDRNPFMFDQYLRRYVKKHSVGMQYVKMVTCIDDEDYPIQKENWDKYIEMVANRKECEEDGYFWAVLEAKVIEGSPVVFASNTVTPTMEITNYDKQLSGTENQPPLGTEDPPPTKEIDWSKISEKILQIN